MGSIVVGLLLLIVCSIVLFAMEYWPIILLCAGIVALIALAVYIIISIGNNKVVDNAVSVEIVNRVPIVEEQQVKTGHSVGWGYKHPSYREYYKHQNVIVGFEVTFRVKLKDGSIKTITCKDDSELYNKLISKIK